MRALTLVPSLPFYRDKLYEPTVYKRFSEILAKARSNKTAGKSDGEIKEFEDVSRDDPTLTGE